MIGDLDAHNAVEPLAVGTEEGSQSSGSAPDRLHREMADSVRRCIAHCFRCKDEIRKMEVVRTKGGDNMNHVF